MINQRNNIYTLQIQTIIQSLKYDAVQIIILKVRGEEMAQIAEKLLKRWNPVYLFIASKDGFFFGPCNTIVNKDGEIGHLYDKWADKETQGKYLKLLCQFEE